MKKLVLILIALVFILIGCQKQPEDELEKETTGNDSENTTNHVDPNPSINIHSLEELEKMREMAESKDEEALNLYLRSVNGGGAHNREDLIAFLDLIDSLPILKLIDGQIVWINYEEGERPTTGEYYHSIIISTEAANGDWTMIEYQLSIDDIPARIERRKTTEELAESILKTPLQTKDGRIKVYSEARKEHPSGIGDFITWILDLDGIYTGVIYYTKHADEVRANEVFQNVVIQSISDY
jgi:uncharacterized lipoprotein NlpE involved in copper resistance